MLDTGKKTGAKGLWGDEILPSKYMIWWKERQTIAGHCVISQGAVLEVLRAWKRGADHYLCHKQGLNQMKVTLNCMKISSKKDVNQRRRGRGFSSIIKGHTFHNLGFW